MAAFCLLWLIIEKSVMKEKGRWCFSSGFKMLVLPIWQYKCLHDDLMVCFLSKSSPHMPISVLKLWCGSDSMDLKVSPRLWQSQQLRHYSPLGISFMSVEQFLKVRCILPFIFHYALCLLLSEAGKTSWQDCHNVIE